MNAYAWRDYVPTPAAVRRAAAAAFVAAVAFGSTFCTLAGVTAPDGVNWRIVWAGSGGAFFGALAPAVAIAKRPEETTPAAVARTLEEAEVLRRMRLPAGTPGALVFDADPDDDDPATPLRIGG